MLLGEVERENSCPLDQSLKYTHWAAWAEAGSCISVWVFCVGGTSSFLESSFAATDMNSINTKLKPGAGAGVQTQALLCELLKFIISSEKVSDCNKDEVYSNYHIPITYMPVLFITHFINCAPPLFID